MFGTPLASDSRYDYDSRMSGVRSYEEGASMLLAQQWKVNDTFSRATGAEESRGRSASYSGYGTQDQESAQWGNEFSRDIRRRRSVSFSRDTQFEEQNMRFSRSYDMDYRQSGPWANESSKPYSDPEYYSQGAWDSRNGDNHGFRNQWNVKDSINGGGRGGENTNWNINDTFSKSGARNTTDDSRNYGAKWNVNDTFSRSGVQGTTGDTRSVDDDTYSRSDVNMTQTDSRAGNRKWNVNDTFSRSGKEGPSSSTFHDRTLADETETQTRTSAGESYDDSTLPTEWEARG